MSCPTCDHTMTRINEHFLWCPRCGTVKDTSKDIVDVAVPKLVSRCRDFGKSSLVVTVSGEHLTVDSLRRWHSVGIAESINLPQDRKGGSQ